MSILPTSLDYTDKDFASIRLRLQALIRSVFPQWTDFNVANFGDILLELFAHVGDILTFYQDNQGRESRLVTATQRSNVINLAKMLGYTPSGAQAATAQEVITLASPPVGTVTISAGSVITTADVTSPESFQTLTNAVFPPGMNPPSVTVTVEHSSSTSDDFTSTGLPDQAYVLSKTPYLDTSAAVTAADGSYTEVDNFLDSTFTDRHFTITVDQNDRATILFGDGVSGTIPSGNITVHYKTGGGEEGNVDAGTLTRFDTPVFDNLGNPVVVTVTNPEKAQGGEPRQSNRQIQVAAPQSLRAETRTVAREDYEINGARVSGVARLLMTTSNEDPAVQENSGILYVVPNGGGAASSLLLSDVLTAVTITRPSTLTFRVSVQTAPYRSINVFVRAYRAKGFLPAQVGFNLRATLKAYFAVLLPDGTPNPNIQFGAHYTNAAGVSTPAFPLGPLFGACEETLGVAKIGGLPSDFLLNNAHQDVALLPREFPTLGTVTIVDGDTGQNL